MKLGDLKVVLVPTDLSDAAKGLKGSVRMQLGKMGLGRMRANLARRLTDEKRKGR